MSPSSTGRLDVGAGRELQHPACPRTRLNAQLVAYLGPTERAAYEVVVVVDAARGGRLVYRQSGDAVDTTDDDDSDSNNNNKWIFVLSTTRSLYVGQKKKGRFQHSSFLAGGATSAAGRLVAKDGVLKAIWPYSGHYLPTEDNFNAFIDFLRDSNVDLTHVKRCSVDELQETLHCRIDEPDHQQPPPEHQHQHHQQQVISRWSSGAGARIGCVRDYPAELQTRALEQVNLSPRPNAARSSSSRPQPPIPIPIPSPRVHHYMAGGVIRPPPAVHLTLPSPKKVNAHQLS